MFRSSVRSVRKLAEKKLAKGVAPPDRNGDNSDPSRKLPHGSGRGGPGSFDRTRGFDRRTGGEKRSEQGVDKLASTW